MAALGEPARPLAVTMGDPAGIGLDITLRAFAPSRGADLPAFVLYADAGVVAARAKRLGLDVGFEVVEGPSAVGVSGGGRLAVVDIAVGAPVEPGRPDPAHAPAVVTAIERAVADVARGAAAAVVTNPIAKSVLHAGGFAHPGHTEFLGVLAERYFGLRDVKPVMMLASDELRVVPLTVHIPLADVPGRITPELLMATIRTVDGALRDWFGLAQPRIAVSGLNPHAGEDGSLGREDGAVIRPTLARLAAEGLLVSGPHPADTLFHAAARKGYDAVVAMYHDQALIPLKTLAFDSGVNLTLGLPFVRTSPDHGTAFDIAGSGTASPTSWICAMRLAARLAAGTAGHV